MSLLIQTAVQLATLENLVRGAWHAHPMENGYGVSPYIWESPTILWLNYGVLERHWVEGHHRVCLQTDSVLAYNWLNTNADYPMEFSNLVLDCRWLLNRD